MNTAPKYLRTALLALVAIGVGSWAWRNFGPPQSAPAPPPPAGESAAALSPAEEPEHLVLVTYFTSDQRCPTCLKIEKQTRAAVETGFADELANDALRFQTLNFDRPENKHFIDRYELAFKTVVVSEHRKGKETEWEKFDDVWNLVGEPEDFARYLQDGIRNYLESAPDA